MTVELQAGMVFTADGQQASAEMQKLAGDLGRTKVAEIQLAEEAKRLKAAIGSVTQASAEQRAELAALITRQAEAQRATQAASRAYDEYQKSHLKVANSAGQMRAASANLGQQINDITQGMAMGTPAATIFAQQAGQVAFALQGMGGAAGTVGKFLGGPWGIALTAAAVVLAPFVSKLFEGEDAAKKKKVADDDLTKALGNLDRATGLANRSAAEGIRLSELATAAEIEEAKKKRDTAKATLDKAQARLLEAQADQRAGGAAGLNFGSSFVTDTAAAQAKTAAEAYQKLRDEIDAAEAAAKKSAAFGRADLASRAAIDPAEKVRQDTEAKITALKALNLSEEEYTRRLTAVRAAEKSSLDALSSARRDAAKDLRDEARAAAEAQRQMEDLVKSNNKLNNALRQGEMVVPGLTMSVRDADKAKTKAIDDAREKDRQQSGLAELVDAAGDRLWAKSGASGDELGKRAADSFARNATETANQIGQIIGGKAGSLMSQVLGLVGGVGPKAGGLTGGATGKLGDLFSEFNSSFAETVGKPFARSATKISDVFGNGAAGIGKGLGQAFGGAATGAMVSGVANAVGIKLNSTGSSLGGAVGAFLPIPGGQIIGSILGGVLGNLFTKTPKGSATISASGGNITQTSGGDATVAKASSALATGIGSAISAIAEQLGGNVGNFAVSIGQSGKYYRVDTTGAGRTKKGQAGVQAFGEDQAAAVQAALADAIRDGAIAGVSPRVQGVLQRYASDVNKAIGEALKVKGLEDLLSDRANPFAAGFRALEEQLKKRVEVAKQYGFDLVEIERINGEDRAAALKSTLASATGSIRALLADMQFGSRATGSPVERLGALMNERDRLTALARAGDNGQADAIANIVQQIDDLQREVYGKTAGFASGRADSVALLNDLMKTTEERINAAADQARAAAEKTNAQLTEANATLDDVARSSFDTAQGIKALTALMQSYAQSGGQPIDKLMARTQ